MALRAVIEHPKTAHLMRLLSLPRYAAIGCLEAVWHFSGRFTPRGDIGKYSDQEIEAWVGWNGDTGKMVSALMESGWLDSHPTYRLIAHDWSHHADKATRNALKRAGLDFCTYAVPQVEQGVRTDDHEMGKPSRLPVPVPVPEPVLRTTNRTDADPRSIVGLSRGDDRHVQLRAAIDASPAPDKGWRVNRGFDDVPEKPLPPALLAAFERCRELHPNCTDPDPAMRALLVLFWKGAVTEADADAIHAGMRKWLDSEAWSEGQGRYSAEWRKFSVWISERSWLANPAPSAAAKQAKGDGKRSSDGIDPNCEFVPSWKKEAGAA